MRSNDQEIAFVSYPVTDVARAVAFYRDTIGLTPGESFGDSVVEFDIGNATFAVDAESVGTPGTQFSAAFEVDDIATMRASLAEKNVPVTEVMEFPHHRLRARGELCERLTVAQDSKTATQMRRRELGYVWSLVDRTASTNAHLTAAADE